MSFLLVATFGCGLGKIREEAHIQLVAFYASIEAGDFEDALSFFAPAYFEDKLSREECLEMLQDSQNALGALKDFKVEHSRVVSDGFVRFHCATEYAKLLANEEIVFDKNEGMEKHMIFDYKIKSTNGEYKVGFWVTKEDVEKMRKRLSEAIKPD